MQKMTIPLSVPFLKGNEADYVQDCVRTGWVADGPYVQAFEQSLAQYIHVPYAVACSNGTTGLLIALRILGVSVDDEVIVPSLTFIAPINAVRYVYAHPIFMDCDDYFNMDVQKLSDFCEKECTLTPNGLRNNATGRIIKCIVPVHVFGNPCDMDAIMVIAEKYQLKVLEDATESLGSVYTKGTYAGKYTGTIGDMGVFSFNGNKIITTGGGGMIVSNNHIFAQQAAYLSTQAKDDAIRYIHHEIGYNARLTNVQAALGVAQMEQLPLILSIKQKNYGMYQKNLARIPGLTLWGTPGYAVSNHWFYALVVEQSEYGHDRESLMKIMQDKGIQTRPIWYLNHWQKPYQQYQAYRIEKASWLWERTLNLPCSANLTEEEILRVVDTLRSNAHV
jgi:perosamine synthetase